MKFCLRLLALISIAQSIKLSAAEEQLTNAAQRSVDHLFRAVEQGDGDGVSYWSELADVNARDAHGFTPLMHASAAGNAEIVLKLIKAGAYIHYEDRWGETALVKAVKAKHNEVTKILIGQDPNIIPSIKARYIIESAHTLSDSQSASSTDSSSDRVFCDDLIDAVKRSDLESVKEWLTLVDVDARDSNGATALMYAAQAGDAEMVTILLESGAQADLIDCNNETALNKAIREGQWVVAHILKCASPKKKTKVRDRLELENRELLQNDIEINSQSAEPMVSIDMNDPVLYDHNDYLRTILLDAIVRDDHEMVQNALASGARVNARSRQGETALIIALKLGHTSIAKYLISAGADVDAPDLDGLTPLMAACSWHDSNRIEEDLASSDEIFNALSLPNEEASEHADEPEEQMSVIEANDRDCTVLGADCEILELLFQRHARVNLQDGTGKTALMHAAQVGAARKVAALVKARADLYLKDKNADTALIASARRGQHKIVQMLLDAQLDEYEEFFKAVDFQNYAQWCKANSKECNFDLIENKKRSYQLNEIRAINEAIEQGDQEVIRVFLKHMQVNKARREQNQLYSIELELARFFLKAVELGHLALVKDLYDPKYARHALHLAIEHQHQDIVAFILDSGIVVDDGGFGPVALSHALETNNAASAELLVAQGAKLPVSDTGKTQLLQAIKQGNYQIFKILLDAGASCEELAREHKTILLDTIKKGLSHGQIARALIERKITLDAADKSGMTAVMWAASEGLVETISCLAKAGANLNARDKNGRTALMHVIETHYQEEGMWELRSLPALLELLRLAANCNIQDNEGDTPLLVAVRRVNIKAVQALLNARADCDITNKNKHTALVEASAQGYLEIVKMLIAAGAKVDLPYQYSGTALCWAAQNGHKEIVEELIAANANVNARFEDAKRNLWAVTAATQGGHFEIVKLLVNAGADITWWDHEKHDTLYYAQKKGFTEIEQFLKENSDDYERQKSLFTQIERNCLGALPKPLLTFAPGEGLFKTRLSEERKKEWRKKIHQIEHFVVIYRLNDTGLLNSFSFLKKAALYLLILIDEAYRSSFEDPKQIHDPLIAERVTWALTNLAEEIKEYRKFFGYLPYLYSGQTAVHKIIELFAKNLEAIILSVSQAYESELQARVHNNLHNVD